MLIRQAQIGMHFGGPHGTLFDWGARRGQGRCNDAQASEKSVGLSKDSVQTGGFPVPFSHLQREIWQGTAREAALLACWANGLPARPLGTF